MSFLISDAYAQAAGSAPSQIQTILPLIFIFGLMYFMVIRPQMKKAKEHRAMVEALAKGDEVITSGGIAGRIIELGDVFATVEIAPNTQIKLQRSAIGAVLPKGTLKSV